MWQIVPDSLAYQRLYGAQCSQQKFFLGMEANCMPTSGEVFFRKRIPSIVRTGAKQSTNRHFLLIVRFGKDKGIQLRTGLLSKQSELETTHHITQIKAVCVDSLCFCYPMITSFCSGNILREAATSKMSKFPLSEKNCSPKELYPCMGDRLEQKKLWSYHPNMTKTERPRSLCHIVNGQSWHISHMDAILFPRKYLRILLCKHVKNKNNDAWSVYNEIMQDFKT